MNYEINKETLAVIALEEEKCMVYEENREFLLNCSSMKVIDDSCKFFGSSYQGRFEGTKNMLNISHKAPIIIEESRGIIFFPTTSPRMEDCSWISLNNIENYYKSKEGTNIKFSCGKVLKFKLAFGIMDNQILRATRLLVISDKRKKIFE